MKSISLTQGKVALVDDADFEHFNQWKWQAAKHKKTWYAVRKDSPFHKTIYMHREIMDAAPGVIVDHKDGDGLNNVRGNLREATVVQNNRNRGWFKQNQTGFKGVTPKRNKFQARIKVNGTEISLGVYDTAEEAAQVYDNATREYFGDFASTNFRI